jgi:hypothetical protein
MMNREWTGQGGTHWMAGMSLWNSPPAEEASMGRISEDVRSAALKGRKSLLTKIARRYPASLPRKTQTAGLT